MLRLRESVLGRDHFSPLLHRSCLDLYCLPAGATNEVMVVLPRGAGTVQRFTICRLQRVGFSTRREVAERSIHRGQPDSRSFFPQNRVQLLRAHESILGIQRRPYGRALPGVALHDGP